jgi:thiol-disulfide isomerase/thioredoxin
MRLVGLLGILTMTTGAALSARAGESATKRPADLVGEAAPLFLLGTLNPDAAGARFVLRDHVGPKARFPKRRFLLDFAASWCTPCRAELRKLVELSDELSGAQVGVAVVVIDDSPEGIETMRALVTEQIAVPYPVVSDRFQVVARRYRVDKLPLAVVLDEDGVVRHVQEGFGEGALDELRAALGLKAAP